MTDHPHGLGRIPSPPDPRDWPVSLAGVDAAAPLPASYRVPGPQPGVLDQGTTPECVAFSAAWEQAWFDLRDTGAWRPDEGAFFHAIGGTADGAVIRTALARRKTTGYPPLGHPERAGQHRIAAYYAVPVTRAGICSAILALGPVVLGVAWARSWFHPHADGTLPGFDRAVGGHAICAVGWDAAGLWLQNSWGSSWGSNGRCRLPWTQLGHVDEAWKAIDVRAPARAFVTVRAGDTLGGIAKAHALTLAALLAFSENRPYRANPSLIHPGDRVRVK